jgi:ADP-ribose pyrophosphatase
MSNPDNNNVKNWKTHASTPLLSAGKWLAVEERTVETPGGQVIEHWPWVITPNYVNVLAINEAGQVMLFRQGKYGFEGESLAPVGGYIEPGEEPLAAAKRELLEETGCEASQWTHLGRFQVDPNRGVAWGDLYLARGARQVAAVDADDLEEQELLLLSLPQVEAALAEGRFKVLAWAANVALAVLKIKSAF